MSNSNHLPTPSPFVADKETRFLENLVANLQAAVEIITHDLDHGQLADKRTLLLTAIKRATLLASQLHLYAGYQQESQDLFRYWCNINPDQEYIDGIEQNLQALPRSK